jgi:hypothetical protein
MRHTLQHLTRPQRLPVSVKEIVANSPVLGNEGIIYLGSKTSTVYAIDLETGQVFDSMSSPAMDEW